VEYLDRGRQRLSSSSCHSDQLELIGRNARKEKNTRRSVNLSLPNLSPLCEEFMIKKRLILNDDSWVTNPNYAKATTVTEQGR
jgi:hypothetical protein